MRKIYMLFIIICLGNSLRGQSFLDSLEAITPPKKEFTMGTFKGVRIINGQSVEMPAKGELLFMIQHRFGSVRGGIVDLFGLDLAGIRFGLEYTLPFYDGRICI